MNHSCSTRNIKKVCVLRTDYAMFHPCLMIFCFLMFLYFSFRFHACHCRDPAFQNCSPMEETEAPANPDMFGLGVCNSTHLSCRYDTLWGYGGKASTDVADSFVSTTRGLLVMPRYAKDVEEDEEDDTEKNQSLADTNAVTQIWRLNSCGLRIELAVPKKLMVLAQVSQSIRFRILCGSALPGL